MASELFRIANGVTFYRHETIVYLVSQDKVANTSRIRYEYYVTNTGEMANGSWTTLGDVAFRVTVNGNAHAEIRNFDFRVTRGYLMVEGEMTIAHDTNGLLNLTVAMHGDANPGSLYFLANDASSTKAVPSIARASSFTVTPNPVIEGGEVAIAITRASTSYTHDVTWEGGGSSGTIATGVATSTTWSPDVALLASTNKVVLQITVTTKNGATVIGSKSYDLIYKAAPDYPTVGQGTPYDVRLRRVEYDIDDDMLIAKERIPYLSLTTTDTLSASASCSLSVSPSIYEFDLDEAVVLAEFYDGAQWITDANLLLVLTRTETDQTDMTGVASYTGMSYVDYMLSKGVVPSESRWDDKTPGDVMNFMFWRATQRGWGTMLDTSFDASKTSANTNWQNRTTFEVSLNQPLSQSLDGMVTDILVEYRSHFDPEVGHGIFEMYNPGYGEDWTVAGADPIVNLSLAALNKVADAAPVRKDAANKLTRVYVVGDESSQTRERADAVDPAFGHLEGSASATGVKDNGQLQRLGDAILSQNESATVERTFSYDLSSSETPTQLFPYRTFRPGDWILIPGDEGPIRARVAQVAITRNEDGAKATITTGDLIPSGVAANARKIAQTGGGAIAGGTLGAPRPLSSAIPSAPEAFDGTTGGYWDPTGAPKSGIDLTWEEVTTSLSGTPLIIDLYEVWTRPAPGAPWVMATFSTDTNANISPLEIDQSLELRVRGRSNAGVFGEFSDVLTKVTAAPSVDLDGPIMTDLYTDGVGGIYAVWGGELGVDPAPMRLAYVTAEVSSDAGATYVTMGTPIVAAGTIVIQPGAYGEYMVRLRGYDRLGNAGDASTPDTITTTDPGIDPSVPEPPTNLASTPGADWDAAGISPEAWFDLTWDVPTLDLDGNAIEIAGYDIWGKRDTGPEVRFLTSSVTNTVRWLVEYGETWAFQVRAVSNFGGVSDFSETVVDTADETIDVPDAPAEPTLSQYAGILRINWSGNGMVPQIKYAYASISTDNVTFTRAGMPLNGQGEVVVPGLATDTDYYAKINLVDELGQVVSSAAAGPITLLPITGVTIQTSPIANTGIKMTNAGITAYDALGFPTFVLDAGTGEVWIAPYDAVFEFGALGTTATGVATTGLAISSENSSFNTFIHPAGMQIRNDQTALSWWEADASDANLVNFFSPRAVIGSRILIGDYEAIKEDKGAGASRLVFRYKGA